MSTAKVRWQCPQCLRHFQIPAGKQLRVCPDCKRAEEARFSRQPDELDSDAIQENDPEDDFPALPQLPPIRRKSKPASVDEQRDDPLRRRRRTLFRGTAIVAYLLQWLLLLGAIFATFKFIHELAEERPEVAVIWLASAITQAFFFAVAGGVRAIVHIARHVDQG